MSICIYLDEDAMQGQVATGLRSHRIDVLTAKEARMLNRADEDHLEFATRQGRVLYSFNIGHFLRIHTEWVSSNLSHTGIILARQKRYSAKEQIRKLAALVEAVPAEAMKNRVEFLSRW